MGSEYLAFESRNYQRYAITCQSPAPGASAEPSDFLTTDRPVV